MTDNDSLQLGLLEPCISLMTQGLQASTRGQTALAHVSKTLRVNPKTAIVCRECVAGLLLHSALKLMEQLMVMYCRVWARGNGRL